MIKVNTYKYIQFVCLNIIAFCFAWICYQWFRFSEKQSFFDRFSANINGLFGDRVVLFIKNVNRSLLYPLKSFMKFLNWISGQWLDAICWSCCLSAFSLMSLGTLKLDCGTKTSVRLSFVPVTNNSVTIVLNFY